MKPQKVRYFYHKTSIEDYLCVVILSCLKVILTYARLGKIGNKVTPHG